MNVRMTIGAMRAHILEDETGVAFRAAHLCVHAAQRIAGLVMIELRI